MRRGLEPAVLGARIIDAALPHAYFPAMARAVAASAPSGPWIVGPGYDQLFLWAAWCVPLALWAIAVSIPYGLLVALVVFVLLDNSHQVATLPLTIFDPA